MSGAIHKLAAAVVATLVAGLVAGPGLTGSLSAGAATGGYCEGQSAPANHDASNQAPVPTDDTVTTVAGTTVTIRVLANDTDPDGDRLYLENATAPRRGDVCVNHNGTIDYLADSSPTDYTSSFTYGVTDGDRYRTATVTVNVTGVRPMRPVLQQRLVLEQHSHHAKQRARVSFTNPNSYRMLVLAGSPRKKNPSIQHFVYPGHPFTVTTKERRLQYVTVLAPRSSDAITLVNEGVLNTRNGHLRGHYVGLTLGPGFDKVHTATAAQRAWAHR